MDSKQSSLYPKVADSNPDADSPFLSAPPSAPPLYPSLDMRDLAENLFPDSDQEDASASSSALPAPPPPVEETIVAVPGAILHLIDDQQSLQLASGDFSVLRLKQDENTVAVLARVGAGDDFVQWPLTRDEAAVKLDASHYFFALHVPVDQEGEDNVLNYGLTFAPKGPGDLLDGVLDKYTSFSVKEVDLKVKEISEKGVEVSEKEEIVEKQSAVYWTTLAPNVEDYSHSVARLIAMGSGQLIRGILWTGEVTADRLKWGEDFLKKRMGHNEKAAEVSKKALKRMKRVKKITKMSDNVANAILSGVIKVSGFFTSSVVNSGVGKRFFSMLPGEVILATLDGFVKICDAAEVAGKNVLQTSSVVTTGLVSHRYGEQAGEITHDYLHATGHALGTAWAVFKIRKALNPKNVVKSKRLVKEVAILAASEVKTKEAEQTKEVKQTKQSK